MDAGYFTTTMGTRLPRYPPYIFYCVLFVAYRMTNEAVKIIGNKMMS